MSLALQELKHKADHLVHEIKEEKGGVSFKGPKQAAELNKFLKIPTRLLLEIERFKARDLPKLYKKTRTLPWHKYIYGSELKWQISTSTSRLMHTGKIEETMQEGLEAALKASPAKKSPAQNPTLSQIFVQFQNDEVSVSLDTSGEALYKRGLKTASVKGPLRESLAYACLFWLGQKIREGQQKDLLKAPLPFDLIDPMAGSGSFILEALRFETPIASRSFSYQHSPFFRELERERPLIPNALNFFDFQKIKACDLKTDALEKNLPANRVDIQKQDAFELVWKKEANSRLVILNPPYGERIAKSFSVPALLHALKKNLASDYIGLMAPRSWDIKTAAHEMGLEILGRFDLKNGGLAVSFWALKTP